MVDFDDFDEVTQFMDPPVTPGNDDDDDEYTPHVGGVEETKDGILGDDDTEYGTPVAPSGHDEHDDEPYGEAPFVPTATVPTKGRGMVDLYGSTYQTFKAIVERLHDGANVDAYAKHEGIETMDDIHEYIEMNWDAYWRKVIIVEVLGIRMNNTTANELATLIETSPELAMLDLVMLTKDNWKEDYGLKIPSSYYRRLQAFHRWMTNPQEKLGTITERLTCLTAEEFDEFMINEGQPSVVPTVRVPSVASRTPTRPTAPMTVPTIRHIVWCPLRLLWGVHLQPMLMLLQDQGLDVIHWRHNNN